MTKAESVRFAEEFDHLRKALDRIEQKLDTAIKRLDTIERRLGGETAPTPDAGGMPMVSKLVH